MLHSSSRKKLPISPAICEFTSKIIWEFFRHLFCITICITNTEMITLDKINLSQKLSLFNDYWSPKIVGELNGYSYELHMLSGNGAILRGKSAGQQFI